MEKFVRYLSKKHIGNAKQRSYYGQWVSNLYRYVKKSPGQRVDDFEIKGYLSFLGDTHHDWQVQQAKDAIRLYLYFQSKISQIDDEPPSGNDGLWVRAIEMMTNAMRLKHLSYRTEQTYLGWMRQFYRYVQGEPPSELKSKHVIDFLTYLATERKVAKATQNLAFNSI